MVLDLDRGKCHDAASLSPVEARQRATFVIEGSYKNWMKVLKEGASPLMMLMRGKLRFSKGSIRVGENDPEDFVIKITKLFSR